MLLIWVEFVFEARSKLLDFLTLISTAIYQLFKEFIHCIMKGFLLVIVRLLCQVLFLVKVKVNVWD